jgi:hypothetical protein
MVALASDLNFTGSRFLAGLTAVFVASLRETLAWKVCTLSLLSCRHRDSPFLSEIEVKRLWTDRNGVVTASVATGSPGNVPRL